MTDITIRVIPHHLHRYPTCGDYYETACGDVVIEVSATPDWRSSFAVAIHELIEAALCKQRGVEWAAIDRFDTDFEAARTPDNDAEPGDDPRAPYRREHRFAENIERLLAAELGLEWSAHERAIGDLA